MKKILSMLLVLMMLLTASAALADGMGVQVIGGPETETEPVSLDDIKLSVAVDIPDYAILTPTAFEFADHLGHYIQGRSKTDFYAKGDQYYYSGNEADYAILRFDITNTSMSAVNFLEACEVKVVFDDKYEYAGWFYQSNFDNGTNDYSLDNYWYGEQNKQNKLWAIHETDVFAINPMYTGHYIFGCTLPNVVVESKLPLRMEIKLGGNEITYNIRK